MAHLGRKNDTFLIRFRFQGNQFQRSLMTNDLEEAQLWLHRIEALLVELKRGLRVVPPGVDAGDFIASGGQYQRPPEPPASLPTLREAVTEFLANLGHLAETNRYTHGVHLRHLLRHLAAKSDQPVDQLTAKDLEGFLQDRLGRRSSTTVAKERETVAKLCTWSVHRGYLAASPAAGLPRIKEQGHRPPFRTLRELEEILQRGGLDDKARLALWNCLYLAPAEIAELLRLVRERHPDPLAFLLHALPAYTGMRRGELLRLRWSDLDVEQGWLTARSRKQSRQATETIRRIDMHPELQAFLQDWRRQRTRGQFVLCQKDTLEALTPVEANRLFWHPLRGTSWCLSSRRDQFKLGFHTYRHSFASNLAAQGVDQRVIDEFMGHTTEAMRRRYRHLFPSVRKAAILSFTLAASTLPAVSSSPGTTELTLPK